MRGLQDSASSECVCRCVVGARGGSTAPRRHQVRDVAGNLHPIPTPAGAVRAGHPRRAPRLRGLRSAACMHRGGDRADPCQHFRMAQIARGCRKTGPRRALAWRPLAANWCGSVCLRLQDADAEGSGVCRQRSALRSPSVSPWIHDTSGVPCPQSLHFHESDIASRVF